jgi:photosystem II stability/assembly factor-like uncharacterized protein
LNRAGILIASVFLASGAWAQDGALVESEFGILSNSVANLHAQSDSLWLGPFLNLTVDGGASWLVSGADSLFDSDNRVFSLDVEGSTIWIGLGRSDRSTGESVQTAAGFLVSTDGGRTFDYRFPQLDGAADETIQYGVNTLSALPVIVPQQSPPFDIDFDPTNGDVWVAGWASGLRRSSDGGLTWSRVVLPPDDLDYVHPDSVYSFRVEPQRGGMGQLNHMGFAVLVAEDGTVWAGTPVGVNRSTDGGSSWRRFSNDGTPSSLTGNWVISIEEQPLTGQNPIWMATWNSGGSGAGQFGAAVTRDGGESFQQTLQGEKVYDFAFRGETVYAASDGGLYISADGGRIWRSVRDFRDRARPEQFIRPGASVFSVATTSDAVWVGTEDGLLKSTDDGNTWTVIRVEVPTNPAQPTDRTPRVDAFAYPNPYSPAIDSFVRLRYELPSSGTVRIRIVDYGMSLVREWTDSRSQGTGESVWDGRDARGLRVANAPYFYSIKGPGGFQATGKILVIE